MSGLVSPGLPGLVALSGGPDSLALLIALLEIPEWVRAGLTVGHVDHDLRSGSAEEALRVRQFVESMGLCCMQMKVSVQGHDGLEGNARRERYRALGEMARESGSRWIATAHTASDQAETVLMRLARGAGSRGARGILPRRGIIIRPMLGIERAEIELFLRSRRLEPLVTDPSNRDQSRPRNRIRHTVLPELRKSYPGVERALAAFASHAAMESEALDTLVPTDRSPERTVLQALPEAVRRRWVRQRTEALSVRLGREELAKASRLILSKHNGDLELGRRVLLSAGERVTLSPRPDPPDRDRPEAILGEETPCRLAWAALELRMHKVAAGTRASGLFDLALGPDTVFPLSVRGRRPGDRLRLNGGFSRKLKKVLMEKGVPRHQRERVPVVVDGNGEILWVVGVCKALPEPAEAPAWMLRATPL